MRHVSILIIIGVCLCREYLAPGAPCEINIDSKTMEGTVQSIKQANRYAPSSLATSIYVLGNLATSMC